jgi:hypothetical protein
MKRACWSTHSIRSGIPNVGRVRPSTTLHLPYFQMTYGWATTPVLLACLLDKWKFGDGRAWEISLVVLTSVSGNVSYDIFGYPVRSPPSSLAVISPGLTVACYSVRMRRPDKGGTQSFLFGSRSPRLVLVQACDAGRCGLGPTTQLPPNIIFVGTRR